MKLDIERLKGLAEAAQKGPWVSTGNWVSTLRGNSVAECPRGDEDFIAAANPSAVLELIAEIKRLKAVEDYLELEMSGEKRAKLMLAEKLGCADEPRWKWMLISADDLNAENEAMRKDTARLDRLEMECEAHGTDVHEGNRWVVDGPFATVRDAIDAAMTQEQP